MLFSRYVLSFDFFNFFFILFISICLCVYVQKDSLNLYFISVGNLFSTMLLEIYLLHPYMKINLVNEVYSILTSIFLTLMVSFFLVNLRSVILNYLRK